MVFLFELKRKTAETQTQPGVERAELMCLLRNKMLPKRKRVNKKTFQVLLKDGKTLASSFFLLYFMKSEDPHYSFVAPKKNFRSAVKRNKYKRLGYNALKEIPLNNGMAVFLYKKEAINANKEEIKENILFLLKKIGFYK